MFNRKSFEETEDEQFKIGETPKETVSCNDCKCLICKEDAQLVLKKGEFYSGKSYYCGKCKKPYSYLLYKNDKLTFFKEIQVNEKGEPVGYKKLTK